MDQFTVDATIAFAAIFVFGQQIIGSIAWLRGDRQPYFYKSPIIWIELPLRLIAYIFLGLYASNPIFQQPFPWVPVPVRLLGLPLMAAGLVISLVGHHQLGQYWVSGVAVYRGHKLVTKGLYHRIRHPMYFGLCLGFIGIALLGASKATTVAAIFMMAAILGRIPFEEYLLYRYFKGSGQEAAYAAYQDTVPILIPGVPFRLPRRRQPAVEAAGPRPRPLTVRYPPGPGPSQRPPAKRKRKRRRKKNNRHR
jgi:protein-S-isoprenylcysteine O-methyltransferase Ste14